MYDLIIRDATIICAGARRVADIAVEEGLIAHVGPRSAGSAREEISGAGRFVIPGLVEPAAHLHPAGHPARVDLASISQQAVCAGVTTLIELPGRHPPLRDRASLALRSAGPPPICSVGFWGSAMEGDQSELLDLCAEGALVGPYACLDERAGAPTLSEHGLEQLFAQRPPLVGLHAELPADPPHSPAGAVAALQRILPLIRAHQVPVLCPTITSSAELGLLDPLRGELPLHLGLPLPHLFLTHDSPARAPGQLHTLPPLREDPDRRALWVAAKRGRVDLITSAHRAWTRQQKASPSPPPGLPGLDLLLPLLLGAVKNARLTLERMVELCCEGPARTLGLRGKGRIEVGAEADLVIFSEGDCARLQRPPPLSGLSWSPYIGRDVGRLPELVLVAGCVVARQGQLAPDPPAAQPLRYNRS